jgi:ABC-type dipeptide/oligopeptide/nickel transport system ATPase component
MDAGRIVESAATSRIFDEPKHPYDQALQKSIPAPRKRATSTRFRVLRLISPSRFQAIHSRPAANLKKKCVTPPRPEGNSERPFFGSFTN